MAGTQLWVGNHEKLINKAYVYAGEFFGVENEARIRSRQFYGVFWLSPEKNAYTRADLEPLFEKIAFALGHEESCVVVIEHADLLSGSCANSLLKILEEPATGYHFILLAEHRDSVMPTIQSRALITEFFSSETSDLFSTFLTFFKNPVPGNHIHVMQELERVKMTESQARKAVDQLYQYWVDRYKKALVAGDDVASKKADRMMRVCVHASESPPMPGSVKLFWKNIYLLMTL